MDKLVKFLKFVLKMLAENGLGVQEVTAAYHEAEGSLPGQQRDLADLLREHGFEVAQPAAPEAVKVAK